MIPMVLPAHFYVLNNFVRNIYDKKAKNKNTVTNNSKAVYCNT